MQIMRKLGRISRSKRLPRPTLRSGRASRTNFNTSRRIPARVIEANRDVRFTPKSRHVQRTSRRLLWAKSGHHLSFDHHGSTCEQCRRHGETNCSGGLKIDNQLVLSRRLHRKVGGLLALENAIDVAGSLPVWLDRVGPVTNQATVSHEETERIGCRQSMSRGERYYHAAMSDR